MLRTFRCPQLSIYMCVHTYLSSGSVQSLSCRSHHLHSLRTLHFLPGEFCFLLVVQYAQIHLVQSDVHFHESTHLLVRRILTIHLLPMSSSAFTENIGFPANLLSHGFPICSTLLVPSTVHSHVFTYLPVHWIRIIPLFKEVSVWQ